MRKHRSGKGDYYARRCDARANQFAGRQLPTTALTLLMREASRCTEAIGGMGADSL